MPRRGGHGPSHPHYAQAAGEWGADVVLGTLRVSEFPPGMVVPRCILACTDNLKRKCPEGSLVAAETCRDFRRTVLRFKVNIFSPFRTAAN